MFRQKFNEGWTVSSGTVDMLENTFADSSERIRICLPHDAMITEARKKDTANGSQTGFYPGGIYHYRKKFYVPEAWCSKILKLEFEGAYMNAKVYVNGCYAGGYPYGYTNFYVELNHFLEFGKENDIEVIVNNGMERNSRWYSGSGLYRNVNLFIGEELHILEDGVRITTPEVDKSIAVTTVDTRIRNQSGQNRKVKITAVIKDKTKKVCAKDVRYATIFGHTEITSRHRMAIHAPALWNCETPDLYECTVRIEDRGEKLDEVKMQFGVRSLQLDAVNGLRINGERIKLRGACIHHDNGVIGACTLERAEERRCEQLKAAGFNCIRSSHHPMSKAMLDACDRLGMLVIDELSDVWTNHKNVNDYSMNFLEFWEKDVERMVKKDYNHPSVIMYCMGNEIQEAGTAKGAELNRRINEKFHILDGTRYTTNAINGILAIMDSLDIVIADAVKANAMAGKETPDRPSDDTEKKNEGGSDALNDLLGMLHGPLADAIATHPILSEKLDEFVDAMDVAGYNYLTGRHEMEHQLYPNRVVLGAETFPADIVRLWDIVERNPHVLGDMTWSGYDYLGEARAGIFYYDGTKNFTPHWPDRAAYIGDIDITGYRRPISYLREIVYGLRKEPYIAVERLNHYGEKHSKTPWMFKDNIASWTWNGFDCRPAKVDVYSDAEEVELFLNGRSLGRKCAGRTHGYTAEYNLVYEPGELKAAAYRNGIEDSVYILYTAAEDVELSVEPDRSEIYADGEDLSYVVIEVKDKSGRENRQCCKNVKVRVIGEGTLQGYGSALPSGGGSYQDTAWDTYDGRALAVVRAGKKAGEIRMTFEADGCRPVCKVITTKVREEAGR